MFKGIFSTKSWKENVNHNFNPKLDKNTEMDHWAVFQYSLGLNISVLTKLEFNRQNYAQQFCISHEWNQVDRRWIHTNKITKFIENMYKTIRY
jgi:hypothetical protein